MLLEQNYGLEMTWHGAVIADIKFEVALTLMVDPSTYDSYITTFAISAYIFQHAIFSDICSASRLCTGGCNQRTLQW